MHMATKTISLAEQAYQRLAAHKQAGESFSNTVLRLTQSHSLLEIAGILTKAEADELEDHIQQRRTSMRKRMEQTAREIERP